VRGIEFNYVAAREQSFMRYPGEGEEVEIFPATSDKRNEPTKDISLYIVEESVRAERWGAIEILLF
jgi:hypothetical protein